MESYKINDTKLEGHQVSPIPTIFDFVDKVLLSYKISQ